MTGSWMDSSKARATGLTLAVAVLVVLVVALVSLAPYAVTTAERMATATSQTDGHPVDHHGGADTVCHLAFGCGPALAYGVDADSLMLPVGRSLIALGEGSCRGRFLPPNLRPPIA